MLVKPFKSFAVVFSVAALAWFVCGAAIFPAHAQSEARLKIAATTTLIAEIVRDLGGDGVDVVTMIPPASCPGHFDVKPDDMKLLAHARIFMLHCWQGRQFGDDIIRVSGNPKLKRAVIEVEGNWMTPSVQAEATDRIADVLAEADPAHGGIYRAAAEKRKAEVRRVGSVQAARLAKVNAGGVPVLANEMQADFVRWAGFTVVGVFGRGEDMSPRDMQDVIRRGRKKAVRLVVDNLQSGKQAGVVIAKEIGAAQVTLSNFPGGFPDTDVWRKAIEKNVDLLLAAVGKP